MGLPGPLELAIIAIVVVLLFGVKKLPQLGGAVGESIRNFKKGIKDVEGEEKKSLEAESARRHDSNTPS